MRATTSERRASRYGAKSRSPRRTACAPSPSKPTRRTSTVTVCTAGSRRRRRLSSSVPRGARRKYSLSRSESSAWSRAALPGHVRRAIERRLRAVTLRMHAEMLQRGGAGERRRDRQREQHRREPREGRDGLASRATGTPIARTRGVLRKRRERREAARAQRVDRARAVRPPLKREETTEQPVIISDRTLKVPLSTLVPVPSSTQPRSPSRSPVRAHLIAASLGIVIFVPVGSLCVFSPISRPRGALRIERRARLRRRSSLRSSSIRCLLPFPSSPAICAAVRSSKYLRPVTRFVSSFAAAAESFPACSASALRLEASPTR